MNTGFSQYTKNYSADFNGVSSYVAVLWHPESLDQSDNFVIPANAGIH